MALHTAHHHSTFMLPRRPILIMSPKRLELVGSPTTQTSIVSPRSADASAS